MNPEDEDGMSEEYELSDDEDQKEQEGIDNCSLLCEHYTDRYLLQQQKRNEIIGCQKLVGEGHVYWRVSLSSGATYFISLDQTRGMICAVVPIDEKERRKTIERRAKFEAYIIEVMCNGLPWPSFKANLPS